MQLTNQQIKKANKLLDQLCKNRDLGAKQVYSIFDSNIEAEDVCTILEKKQLLIANWVEGHGIFKLRRNENTCNALETNLLDKELSSEKRTIISSKLNIIVAILSIASAITGFGIGIFVSHSPKSNDVSTIKANLDACETSESECLTRESNLNHVVDSLKKENKILVEKAQTK